MLSALNDTSTMPYILPYNQPNYSYKLLGLEYLPNYGKDRLTEIKLNILANNYINRYAGKMKPFYKRFCLRENEILRRLLFLKDFKRSDSMYKHRMEKTGFPCNFV